MKKIYGDNRAMKKQLHHLISSYQKGSCTCKEKVLYLSAPCTIITRSAYYMLLAPLSQMQKKNFIQYISLSLSLSIFIFPLLESFCKCILPQENRPLLKAGCIILAVPFTHLSSKCHFQQIFVFNSSSLV